MSHIKNMSPISCDSQKNCNKIYKYLSEYKTKVAPSSSHSRRFVYEITVCLNERIFI